jgi:hypothetical protein
MANLYRSKYYSDLSTFLKEGWTEEEINTYFPILESLNEQELLQLHNHCKIKMFSAEEGIDKEQAIHALVNPKDTPKYILIEAIKNRKGG